jgi:serine protease Do
VGDTLGEAIERLRRITVQVRTHRNGAGSGVIWSRDGRIVTNAHVVEGAGSSGSVEVELWDGRRFPGRIENQDRRRDLAVLQVDASGLDSATSGNSHALRVGELVIAVGNPLGFTGAASTGVVHESGNLGWVVSQIRLAPGNSGGPLANARGEVVGLNTMIARGLAFAIPSFAVNRFVSTPFKDHDGLGVVVRPVKSGLIVLEVIPRSAADRASLLQGDILVGAGGKRFQSIQDLGIAIDRSRGGILELQFRRGRKRQHSHSSDANSSGFSESGVIRVLVGSRSSTMLAALENTIRSSPMLEFAGVVDPDRHAGSKK